MPRVGQFLSELQESVNHESDGAFVYEALPRDGHHDEEFLSVVMLFQKCGRLVCR
jgi:hypothetical protein